jgi:hypothetical protein
MGNKFALREISLHTQDFSSFLVAYSRYDVSSKIFGTTYILLTWARRAEASSWNFNLILSRKSLGQRAAWDKHNTFHTCWWTGVNWQVQKVALTTAAGRNIDRILTVARDRIWSTTRANCCLKHRLTTRAVMREIGRTLLYKRTWASWCKHSIAPRGEQSCSNSDFWEHSLVYMQGHMIKLWPTAKVDIMYSHSKKYNHVISFSFEHGKRFVRV